MLSRLLAIVIAAIFTFNANLSLAQDRNADHAEIIELRDKALRALNERKYDLVKDDLHSEFIFTSVDNKVFHSAEEFQAYWEELHNTVFDGIDLQLTVDDKTKFLSEDAGVATGGAVGTFKFSNLDDRTMKMRWSALLERQNDRWTLRMLHFSADLTDNPVLDAAKTAGVSILTIVPALIALVIGFLIGWIVKRRRVA